jgi:phage protein D
MEKMTVLQPSFRIVYSGRDVTADLSAYVTEVRYTDRLTGQSDELDVTLGDDGGRWLGAWYPDKGAEMSLEYGYAHQRLVSAGGFDVDEVEISGPPSVVRIRALSTGITRQVRTRRGKAYENTTLKAIVAQAAKRIGAKVSGEIGEIAIDRVTQYQETDWAFVVRLCREYGYTAKLCDNNRTLVVARAGSLAEQSPVRTLYPSDLTSWRYADKVTDVPSKTSVRYHNPDTKEVVEQQAQAGDVASQDTVTAQDENKQHVRARSAAQAKAIAEAEQQRREQDKVALNGTLPGDPKIVAGAIIDIHGLRRLNGLYLVTQATHSMGRSGGYVTEFEAKRVKEGGDE